MRFQNGDIVRISKSSHYYGKHPTANPKDEDGKIIRVLSGSTGIRVEWDNGDSNGYSESDLRLRRRP